MKGSSSFGDFCGNKEFSDVTLACEDGQLVEAHEVILAGPSPKTTIHTPWFQLGDILSSKLQKEREGFLSPPQRNLLNNLRFRRLGLHKKETQQSKIR